MITVKMIIRKKTKNRKGKKIDYEKRIFKLLEEQNAKLNKILKSLSAGQTKRHSVTAGTVAKQRSRSGKVTVARLILELKDERFFNSPKTLNEIVKKLEEKNYIYPVTSLTLPLQKLVRGRELGRILKAGKWSYVKR
ncbi:MAG: hypothetical protein HMLIMOIP_001712 [Candidatus Nitrosomirales archaeon]|jgi:hypothetical protein